MSLMLATNTDAELCANLIEMVNSGRFHFLIPYTYCTKTSTGSLTNTSNFNLTQKINRGWGINLVKVYASFWAGREIGFEIADCSNSNAATGNTQGTKIQNLYSLLDGNRLQDQNLDSNASTASATTGLDWLYNRRYVKGSSLAGRDGYEHKFFHMDQFGEPHLGDGAMEFSDNLLKGISLDSERRHDIYCTAASYPTNGFTNGLNCYVFYVTQKRVSIGAGGVTVL